MYRDTCSTHSLLGILLKMTTLKLFELFSGHRQAIMIHDWPKTPFYYLGLLLQLQNVSFQNFRACPEGKLSRVFGLILTFYYRFIYSPCFSLFWPRFFSPFAEKLPGFIWIHFSFWKSLYSLRIRWKESYNRRVVVQYFHDNFGVNVTCFFVFFPGLLDWIVFILV